MRITRPEAVAGASVGGGVSIGISVGGGISGETVAGGGSFGVGGGGGLHFGAPPNYAFGAMVGGGLPQPVVPLGAPAISDSVQLDWMHSQKR